MICLIKLSATDDRRGRGGRREDPRRHTLGGDMLHYGGQGQPQRTMDLEVNDLYLNDNRSNYNFNTTTTNY